MRMQEPGDAEGNKGYAFGIFAGEMEAKRTTYVKYISSCYFLLLRKKFPLLSWYHSLVQIRHE